MDSPNKGSVMRNIDIFFLVNLKRLLNKLICPPMTGDAMKLTWRRRSDIAARSILTHWGRVTHICVSKLTSIGPDNGLSPGRRQAIIWTNAGILAIRPLGTNFSEILITILTFSLKKMKLKMSSGKCRPFCLGLNELSMEYLRVIGTLVLTCINFNPGMAW